jgi:hypothetical protein
MLKEFPITSMVDGKEVVANVLVEKTVQCAIGPKA